MGTLKGLMCFYLPPAPAVQSGAPRAARDHRTLPVVWVSPGRSSLGPDPVCDSKRWPGLSLGHQQGSGLGTLPWAGCLQPFSPGTMGQASSGKRQGLNLPSTSAELCRPKPPSPAGREGPSPVSKHVLLLNLEEPSIPTQPAKFSLDSPLLPQSTVAGQTHTHGARRIS